MIKFYQGQWSAISGKVGSANNIVFVTDRQVLMMGGKEYGKDGGAIKIEAGSGYTAAGEIAGLGARDVAEGTLFYFTGDQSILKYISGTTWEAVQTPTLYSADLISQTADASGSIVFNTRGNSDNYKATTADVALAVTTLEDKVEAAYENNGTTSITHDTSTPNKLSANHIIVSKASGIGKTDYVLDNGQIAEEVLSAATAASKSDALDTTLINGRTAAKIVEQVSKNKTTIVDSVGNGSGFITWTSTDSVASGTVWTPEFHVLTAGAGALVNNGGTLETALEIKQLSSGMSGYDEGYRSQYALFNVAGGQSVQLGQTINLVKDQFLKAATYEIVYNDTTNSKRYEYDKTNNAWYEVDAEGKRASTSTTSGANWPLPAAAPRCLKLIFALSNKSDNPDTTASDTDSVVYIDVNELFDSYTGVSGVSVNQTTNQISAVVATSAQNNEVRKTASNGTYLNNSANGLYVTGINDDIKAYIQDLGNVTSNANYKFLTGFGVNANGELTGSFAQASAQFVQFSGITAVAGSGATARVAVTGTDVDAALNSISNTIANLDGSYDGSPTTNKPTEFVYAWTQTDGLLATSAKVVDAGDLKASSKTTNELSAIVLTKSGTNVTQSLTGKSQKIYAIDSTQDNVSGTLQSAINTMVQSTAAAFASLDMAQVGSGVAYAPEAISDPVNYTPYKIVNTVVQNDGYVSATDLDLTAQNVGFEPIVSSATHIAIAGYSVGKALSSISQYIAGLDFTTDTPGTAPSAGTSNKYSIVNTVSQADGQVSDVKIDLTAGNTYNAAINQVLPDGTAMTQSPTSDATKSASTVRVGIEQGPVQDALDRISNILADYLSFHNASDAVI